MNGLELARAFFEECGMPMLKEQFSDLMPFLAAGLFGSGSRLGFICQRPDREAGCTECRNHVL